MSEWVEQSAHRKEFETGAAQAGPRFAFHSPHNPNNLIKIPLHLGLNIHLSPAPPNQPRIKKPRQNRGLFFIDTMA
jgi:hypothetical protein